MLSLKFIGSLSDDMTVDQYAMSEKWRRAVRIENFF
jgi:hypothetical protein